MKRLALYFPYIMLLVVAGIVAVSNIPDQQTAVIEGAAKTAICHPCGMTVDRATAIKTELNGTTYYFCNPGCREEFISAPIAMLTGQQKDGHRLVDVVCNMEVNPGWGIQSKYRGEAYFFCVDRCKEQFEANPERYLAQRCMVCDSQLGDLRDFPATYVGETYYLCSAGHRAEFKNDPATFFMHTMWGIPNWLYYVSIGLVLVVSFGVFDLIGKRAGKLAGMGGGEFGGASSMALPSLQTVVSQPYTTNHTANARRADRFDLLTINWISAALRSRVFRFGCQAVLVILFAVIIAAGLLGNQNPSLNIAPILTWTVWWGLLIVWIMFFGKAWCYVCPWDAIAGWTEKLAFWRKRDDGLSLNLKWPRVVRNILIATIMFVGLTWVELGFGVTMKPRVTAYLAIAMLMMAVVSALLFDRKSFCRYGCLVGRVSGLYAMFGGIEVRARDRQTCTRCHTKECVTGSATAYGCPTFLYPGKLEANTYCIQCMECVQACPHDNLALNLRPWGSDLVLEGKPRADEAYLALLMLAITGFHGLTMTPVWQQLIDGIRSTMSVGKIVGFSLGMALLMIGPIAIYAVLVGCSMKLGVRHALKPLTYKDYFIRYAYALLPIALFYHIAHNMEHLLMEGPKVVAMISDPFGWGWNLWGTAAWTVPPIISLDKLWIIQVLLVLVGHVYSLWIAQKTSVRLFGSPKAAFRSQLPMLAGMICFSVFSLWLLKQPMEMRTSAM